MCSTVRAVRPGHGVGPRRRRAGSAGTTTPCTSRTAAAGRDHDRDWVRRRSDEAPGWPALAARTGAEPAASVEQCRHGAGLPVLPAGQGLVDAGMHDGPAPAAQAPLDGLAGQAPSSAWARVTRPD